MPAGAPPLIWSFDAQPVIDSGERMTRQADLQGFDPHIFCKHGSPSEAQVQARAVYPPYTGRKGGV